MPKKTKAKTKPKPKKRVSKKPKKKASAKPKNKPARKTSKASASSKKRQKKGRAAPKKTAKKAKPPKKQRPAKATKKDVFTEEKISQILDKGRKRGFVYTRELISQFPDFDKDIPGLEALYDRLSSLSIDVLERKGFLEAEDEKKAKDTLRPPKIDSVQMYLKEIGSLPMISAREEKELAKRIEKNDQEARKKLARANLRYPLLTRR